MKHVIETSTHIIEYSPRLSEILKERGLTQQQFAEKVGLPQPSISRFDRVTQHKDAYELLISHALGITINDLYKVNVIEKEK